ncbi:MAG: hypothetical protein ABJF11_08385 [Reichenbachiella sp.]|uniref:hypothetical protein n=1 Tax=Reichenbachiella sp. TaxID=2184521 RepID=UPI0032669830
MQESSEKQGFKDLLRDVIIPKAEKIGGVLLLVCFIFKVLAFAGAENLLLISLSTLAVTYYLTPFLLKREDYTKLEIIVLKIGFISCAIVIMGVMFALLNLPGASEMLYIGFPITGLSTIILGYIYTSSETDILKPNFVRFVLALALGCAVFLI